MPSNTSSILLKTAAAYWTAGSIIHAYLADKHLHPYFGKDGSSFPAFIFKLMSFSLSGYFLINGILSWRWADKGISDRYDRAIAVILVVMNSIAGFATLRKAGWSPPPVSLLLGTSALTVASQMV